MKKQPRPAGTRTGHPVIYGEEFVKILRAVWDDYGKPCGKLLVPMTGSMIQFLQESKNPDYGITVGNQRTVIESKRDRSGHTVEACAKGA